MTGRFEDARREAALRDARDPLAGFRERELARMRRTFDDPDATYHALRRAFVRKERPARTPAHLDPSRVARTAPMPSTADVTGTDPVGDPSRSNG